MTAFWQTSLSDTLKNSQQLVSEKARESNFSSWLSSYQDAAPTSSNQGTAGLAFQRWFHFKEAFSPKFVADTLGSLPYKVRHCLDPFSGSGTTAITARMLGLSSSVVEVNPFLADLVEAKLTPLNHNQFLSSYRSLIKNLRISGADRVAIAGMPPTLSEPGVNDRYVFSEDVYSTIRALVRHSQKLDISAARLIKVLLGSVLVECSNVTINGKGRRYRKNWQERQCSKQDLLENLEKVVLVAAADLERFSDLPKGHHSVLRGDARSALSAVNSADVAIFSPPYPNSFDYTDVYNLELWMLGYLQSAPENRVLRTNTLRSHVQTKWNSTPRKAISKELTNVLEALQNKRDELWNANIPEMVGFYFDDLVTIFEQLGRILPMGHHAVVAIGDSQYANVHIDVSEILRETVSAAGFRLTQSDAIRSMRSSSQHGGNLDLSEHCLVFERC
ncbi:hypothetical protein SAMN05518865_13022 [Duganella sp. CF458]|uniref:site-specific DNA-methyltransferase n=1 Tax=Duganella sp. CF458 TaxID=1884368 RepID=UPI0008E029E8|nr:site-specific DNA-methyltransferase [Duganella sp. CF458]SFH01584.1 hypothetical protein SAMN05518865_13022 [Duganella sp. CF458]